MDELILLFGKLNLSDKNDVDELGEAISDIHNDKPVLHIICEKVCIPSVTKQDDPDHVH